MKAVQATYRVAVSRLRVCYECRVLVGFHQGLVLNPLLFIIILWTIAEEFKTWSWWELLYANDLIFIAESASELENQFQVWKQNLPITSFLYLLSSPCAALYPNTSLICCHSHCYPISAATLKPLLYFSPSFATVTSVLPKPLYHLTYSQHPWSLFKACPDTFPLSSMLLIHFPLSSCWLVYASTL